MLYLFTKVMSTPALVSSGYRFFRSCAEAVVRSIIVRDVRACFKLRKSVHFELTYRLMDLESPFSRDLVSVLADNSPVENIGVLVSFLSLEFVILIHLADPFEFT